MSDEENLGLKALSLLAYLALMVFMLTTPAQRRLWAMRAAGVVQRAAAALALMTGRTEMRRELAGGRPAYEVSESLGRIRDAAGVFYERMRAS